MDCHLVLKHMDSYLGGELAPAQVLEFDAHVESCVECREQLAFGGRMRNTMRSQLDGPPVPAAVRARVLDALEREQSGSRWGSDRGVSLGLLAIAAVAMLSLLGGNEGAQQAGVVSSPVFFRDVVDRHTNHLPREFDTDEPERASTWFRDKLGFRVHTVEFQVPDVQLVGVRISHVGRQRAARLYYNVGERRMTAVAFEATPEIRRMLAASDTLKRERIGGQYLSYHTIQGYTVPVIESGGVVYAFTGDLDRPSLLRLVASVQIP